MALIKFNPPKERAHLRGLPGGTQLVPGEKPTEVPDDVWDSVKDTPVVLGLIDAGDVEVVDDSAPKAKRARKSKADDAPPSDPSASAAQ